MAQGDIWDVIDWARIARLAEEDTPFGRMAYAVIGATDPDAAFQRLARAYIMGEPRDHASRRLRVTRMASGFGVEDRKQLARYLRAHQIIGPRD